MSKLGLSCPKCGMPVYTDAETGWIHCKCCRSNVRMERGETPEDALRAYNETEGYR